MKRTVVLVLFAVCVGGPCARPAQALDTQWIAFFRATNPSGASWSPYSSYGTGAASVARLSTWPADGVVLYMPPDYTKYITPAQPAEVVMTWSLAATAGSQYTSGSFRLHAWNPTGATTDIDANPGFRVVLYRGTNVEYIFDPLVNGTSAQPQWTKEYDISAGQTIAGFRLVREPVPEPATATAVLGGLAGVVFLRRRRA